MAYSTTLAPSKVLNREITATRNGFDAIGRFLRSLTISFHKASVANARFQEITALQQKTDEELAAMGLRRDEIGRHVFRDLYYS